MRRSPRLTTAPSKTARTRFSSIPILLVLVGSACALAGCGKDDMPPGSKGGFSLQNGGPGSEFHFSYLACFNCSTSIGDCEQNQARCQPGGCTSGKHESESQPEACRTLNSKSENNDCAADLREKYFKELECEGTFTNG